MAGVAVLLATSGCASVEIAPRVLAPDPEIAPCDGVTVAVDGRALAGTGNGGYAHPRATCVPTDRPMTALAALEAAEVTASRAAEDVSAVCRVEGEPFDGLAIAQPGGGIYVETCTSTPPDSARWVVWSRPSSDVDWTDTHQDLTALELVPGATVALVFALHGEPATPGF